MEDDYGIYINIIPLDKRDKYHHQLFQATCSVCGAIVEKRKMDLKRGNGECHHTWHHFNIENPRLLQIFRGMRDRCRNPNNRDYATYGGKGVKIYDAWWDNPRLFEEWALSNGYADDLTIDRIDSDGDYCPSNCRWITRADNAKYKSTTRLLNVDGEIHTGRDWAQICGFGVNVINTYCRKHSEKETIDFIRQRLAENTNICLHTQNDQTSMYKNIVS